MKTLMQGVWFTILTILIILREPEQNGYET
ncbi:UNVERIFIED_CONTAM: hypothetical protein GTU68_065284 [Idotea baltica]|nr:hypothetical protein [Idotea baltica]